MLSLRRQALPIALLLVATLLAPAASAVSLTWHIAHVHEHAHIGWHAHETCSHHHEHETTSHGADEHQDALSLEAADGSRTSSDELQFLQPAIDETVVAILPPGATLVRRGDAVVRPPSPPGLARLCKLQI